MQSTARTARPDRRVAPGTRPDLAVLRPPGAYRAKVMRFRYAGLLLAACLCSVSMALGAENAEDKLRVVSVAIPSTPWHELWVNFSKRLNERPGNRLQPVLYITGQLGSEESTLSQMRRSRIQMGGFSLQGASAVVPELGVLLAPYLFTSEEEVDFAMDRHLREVFTRLFAEKGLTFLRWGEVGWTSIYGIRPIMSPAESRGLKLRSSNALASQYLVQAIGANMVPLPFPDIIPSLQTGLIDGGASGIVFFAISGAARQAPHVTLTRHAYDTGVILADKKWYEGLPESARQDIEASLDQSAQLRAAVRQAAQQILKNSADYGITFHEISAEQRAAWQSATRGNHKKLLRVIGGQATAVHDAVLRARADFKVR